MAVGRSERQFSDGPGPSSPPDPRNLSGSRGPRRLLHDGRQADRDYRTCGDADDLFIDAKRARIYVSCGAGFVDVLEEKEGRYRRIALIVGRAHFAFCTRDRSSACCCPGEFRRASRHLDIPTDAIGPSHETRHVHLPPILATAISETARLGISHRVKSDVVVQFRFCSSPLRRDRCRGGSPGRGRNRITARRALARRGKHPPDCACDGL
jgi:hypothetical protein